MSIRTRLDRVQTVSEFLLYMARERLESGCVFNPTKKALRSDPFPFYRDLQQRDPVHRSRLGHGWVLSRYDDALAILRDPSLSADERNWSRYARYRARGARAGLPDPYDDDRASMLRLDPPDHTRLRSLVSKAFTPRAVERMRPRIAALADELLLRAKGRRHIDLVEDFAAPLPVIVIAEMLGVPGEDHERFRALSDRAVMLVGDSSFDETREALLAMHELREYFREHVEARRREPRDDLLSDMVAAEEEGDRLSLPELLATCNLLLVAGNETTTKLIGNTVLALLDHPDQLELLRAEPKRIEGAVDEFLRYGGPVQLTSRMVTSDREFRGHRFAAGEQLIVLLGAANRDPEIFDDPDRLDVTRENVRHLAFSQGLHYCLGSQLAKLEASLALEGLITHFPHFARTDTPIEWSENTVLRGPKEVRLSVS